MPTKPGTEPITVRASSELVAELEALAAATDRSRNYIVVQALQQYVANNSWQVEGIKEGIAAADAGDVLDGEEVFASIAKKHGWST